MNFSFFFIFILFQIILMIFWPGKVWVFFLFPGNSRAEIELCLSCFFGELQWHCPTREGSLVLTKLMIFLVSLKKWIR
jgi:hypothetical protein